MASTPLVISVNSGITITKLNPITTAQQSVVQNGPDFQNYSDAQSCNDAANYDFAIPANGSVQAPLPPSTTNAKFVAWKFDNPVTLSGLVSAQVTKYGIMFTDSSQPLSIQAGVNDTKGVVIIAGA